MQIKHGYIKSTEARNFQAPQKFMLPFKFAQLLTFLLLFLPGQSFGAAPSMNLTASNGVAESQSGIWTSIDMSGQQGRPTIINVRSGLTLTGAGNAKQLVSGAGNGVEMRVFGATLRLGNATNANGGVLWGNVTLNNNARLEARNSVGSSAMATWILRALSPTNGSITGNGSLRALSSGFLQAGAIGSVNQPLASITIQDESRIRSSGGIWADTIEIRETSALDELQGNVDASAVTLENASSITASGNISIGSLQSSSTATVADRNSLETDSGNITINGQINIKSGLLSLRSGGDVNFNYDGGAITGAGELYLRANGNVYGAEKLHDKTSIEALRLVASDDVTLKDLLAAQFTAKNVKIGQDLTIKGDSVELFGQKVDYGLLDLAGNENQIGGNLDVADTKISLGSAKIGGDALFNRVEGNFDSLAVASSASLDSGTIAGKSLAAASTRVGSRQFASLLITDSLKPGNLEIGRNGKVKTGEYVSTGGDLAISDDGSLELEKGDLGASSTPLGNITLSNVSGLHAPASIFAKTLSASGSQPTLVAAGQSINISGDISGTSSLSLQAGAGIAAGSIVAGGLEATTLNSTGDVAIYGTSEKAATFKLSGAGKARENLYLSRANIDAKDLKAGKNTVLDKVQGNFANLDTGATLYVAGSNLKAESAAAQTIWLAGENENALQIQKTQADELFVYGKSALATNEFSGADSVVAIADGGKLDITGGNLASPAARAGYIYVSGGSTLEVKGSVYGRELLSFGGQNHALVDGDLDISEDIYGPGWLEVKVGGATSANNISLSAIETGSLRVNGAFYFNGLRESKIAGNFIAHGPESGAASSSSFYKLNVGDTFSISNADIYGYSLKAALLELGSNTATSTLTVTRLDGASGLALGKNAFLGIGEGSREWLNEILKQRESPAQALALKSPFVAASRGVSLDASRSSPVPEKDHLLFGSQSFLAVDGPSTREDNNAAGIISAASPMQAYVRDGSKLLVDGVVANKVYTVLGKNIATHYENDAAWGEKQVETGAHLIALRKIEDRPGSFISYAKPASDIYPGLDGELGDSIDSGFGDSNKPASPTPPSASKPETPELPLPTPPVIEAPVLPALPGQPDASLPEHPEESAPGLVPAPDSPGNSPDSPASPAAPNPGGSTQQPAGSGSSQPGTNAPTRPGTSAPAAPGYPEAGNPEEPRPEPVEPIEPAPIAPGPEPVLGTEDRHFFSPYPGVRYLSRVGSVKYMDHDYNGAVKTLESSSRIAALAAVPQFARNVNQAISRNALDRAFFETGAPTREEIYESGITAWMLPLYQSLNGYGLRANNFNYCYNANIGGVALGLDRVFGKNLRLGLDAAVGGGYSQSGGDLAKTTNNMAFWGIGLYAGWQMGGFQAAADVHHVSTHNSISQELPRSLQMKDLKGDFTARALSEGIEFAWNIPFENFNLRPHAGVRHMWIHTDNYSVYSDGAVLDGQAIEQSIWTFPAGVKFSGAYGFANGWTLAPALDLFVQPAAGYLNARSTIYYTGTLRDATLRTRTGDYFQAGGKIGIEAQCQNFGLGLGWQMLAGPHTTEHVVSGLLKLEF